MKKPPIIKATYVKPYKLSGLGFNARMTFDHPPTPAQIQDIQDYLVGKKHIHANPLKKADRNRKKWEEEKNTDWENLRQQDKLEEARQECGDIMAEYRKAKGE